MILLNFSLQSQPVNQSSQVFILNQAGIAILFLIFLALAILAFVFALLYRSAKKELRQCQKHLYNQSNQQAYLYDPNQCYNNPYEPFEGSK